ncbi:Pheromone receptor 2 [Penicillium digitatum]|uniref:Pheromone receptor 2 n=3 Tax=Penicillium digitatum TaxID=36651 RepID=K9G3Z6_PEND2|nr:Pheromone receptor 2 [Penicillium digitatum Pd1]EKV16094.1 Pheromone receptor 2 [Penicillium digitatum PHI26]EKV19289.1 Pheromone receptor 2 [Penicillium digitatum Pd1]QQK47412.1 Pheromone receptor 2 [Penicillium digitatum]
MAATPSPSPPFDPYTQNVTFRLGDGTKFPVSVQALDVFVMYNVRVCINYGCQFGASFTLLVILLLLTQSDKRRSAVFILNGLALFLNSGRLLFQVIHFSTGFEKVYPYVSGDYSSVPWSAYAISIVAVVLTTLVIVCIEVSLVIQVHVVCSTLRRRYRHSLLVLSILVALVPIGFRSAWMVVNCNAIVTLNYMSNIWWIESATNICVTISICFFCVIFVTKLGFAIKQRRRLGVREYGPMKVIFVMGCQTMVVPAIFSIIQYYIIVPELASNVVTLVVISLPLSSIWAGAALEHSRRSRSQDHQRRRNLWRALVGGAESVLSPTKDSPTSLSAMTAAQTLCYSDHTMSKGPHNSRDTDAFYGIAVEHDILINRAQKNTSIV